MTPSCAGANVRAAPKLSGALRVSLPLGAQVTVTGTVSGGAWSAVCPTSTSGSSWYVISAINGTPVNSTYGATALYAATGVLMPLSSGSSTQLGTNVTSAADPLGDELIRLINLDRVALGESPYPVDPQLSAIARDASFTCPTNPSLTLQGRARDMANRSYFGHVVAGCYLAGTSTPYPSLTIVRTVFGYPLARSEILHWNTHTTAVTPYHIGCDINGANCVGGTTPSPATVAIAQRAFMSSSVHRAAELASYQRIGCGSATVPGTTRTYYACLFANGGPTLPSATPSPTPEPSATPSATVPSPTPSPTPSATPAGTTMTPACARVNVRTAPSLSGKVKTSLPAGALVTVARTVNGGAWSAVCPTAKSGSSWYQITSVNGNSVRSAYGLSSLYAATGVLKVQPAPTPTPTPAPTPAPSPSPSPTPTPPPSPTPTPTPTPSPIPAGDLMTPSCAGANVRAAPKLSGALRVSLPLGAQVTVTGTVSGGAWSAVCPTSTSGSSWYVISAINGTPVNSTYGATALYAATGVLMPLSSGSSTQLGTNVTFYGRGNGHGVGMSQYGALGRAMAGQDAATILAHYYPGTSLGSLGANPSLRVLLEDEAATQTSPLVIYGRGGSWSVDGIATMFPADARALVYRTAAGWSLVVDSGGVVLAATTPGSTLSFQPASGATIFEIGSMLSPYNQFRGAITVQLGTTARLINVVSMEDYLRGAVPAEMPSTWPAAALQAQAIASRSFAEYSRHSDTGSYDLYDDTRSQVYLGVRAEMASTDAAIAATAGQVVMSGSQVADTLYHSTGGGATEDNQLAFVSATGGIVAVPVSYLQGSPDRDASGVSYDASSPYATWATTSYTIDALSTIFGADARTSVGTLTALGLWNRGVSGRLISVTLVGTAGTKTVSGAVFVSVFDANRPSGDPPMWSTLFGLAPIP